MIRLSKVFCEIKNNKINISNLNPKQILAFQNIEKKTKEWNVEFKKYGATRSTEISTRFHGWITFLARETGNERDVVYIQALKKAIEIVADGGSPYPYVIVDDVAYPYRTSGRTNKEMITACFSVQLLADEISPGLILPESVV